MRTYDVTMTLREGMPTWPGDLPFRRVVEEDGQASPYVLSSLHMTAHAGTHVDAPCHVQPDAPGADNVPPDILIGPACVIEIEDPDAITAREVGTKLPTGCRRALFKTRNSRMLARRSAFTTDYVGIEPDAAALLVEAGLKIVGTDYLSVDGPDQSDLPSHRALLDAGVLIVEGLDLALVPPGRYEMFCGMLKVAGGDGAPARVLLREMPEGNAG